MRASLGTTRVVRRHKPFDDLQLNARVLDAQRVRFVSARVWEKMKQ
jgi:hypothetical protein